MDMEITQIHGYEIKYSRVYRCFQIWQGKNRCLEEFLDIDDAIDWCKNN